MLDVARNTGRNIVATRGEGGRKTPDVWMLHVTSFATCSEHVRNTLATSFVECCKDDGSQHGKALRNIAKAVRNICSPCNAIDG
jgi:hypothetical protein